MSSAVKTLLFASPVSDFTGGAERSMFELIINAKNHGYKPVVIVPRVGNIEKRLKESGIKTYRVNFDWWARGATKPIPPFSKYRGSNGTATIKMIQIIEKERPVACVSYTAVFPWLAYAAFASGTPHIWQVCEVLGDTKQWLLRFPLQKTMELIDTLSVKIFANSRTSKKHLLLNLSRHKEEIEVIYPYVNQKHVRQLSRSPSSSLSKTKTNLCLVGNIQPAKGQLDAIKAISELKNRGIHDIHLVLVGKEIDGAYVKSMRKFINDNGLEESVELIGYTDNPYTYVRQSDIALVCSPHEPFGRVTIEAMAIGTAVIGAASDGTKEIIQKDKLYGLLYKSGDYEGLADKIKLLINDTDLRKKISTDARKYVSKNFTLENNQKPFFDYLQKIPVQADAQSSPLSDVIIAYQQEVDQKNQKSKNLKELQRQNIDLSNQINSILASKKYRALSRVAAIQQKVKR